MSRATQTFAILAMLAPASAHAAVSYDITISGHMSGYVATIVCDSGSPPSCLTDNSGDALKYDPFQSDFGVYLGMNQLEEGDNPFSIGDYLAGGVYSGMIHNAGGYLTGQNLTFNSTEGDFRLGVIGSRSYYAEAATFNVSGGIPEPATWALMIIGFGMIGSTVRRKKRSVPEVHRLAF